MQLPTFSQHLLGEFADLTRPLTEADRQLADFIASWVYQQKQTSGVVPESELLILASILRRTARKTGEIRRELHNNSRGQDFTLT
jgi:hypothetical protein